MRSFLIINCFFFGLFFVNPFLYAREVTIYVSSTSGDDNNSGITEDYPMKTITRALKKGDVVLLKSGDVFFESLQLKNKRIGKYGRGKNPQVSGFKRVVRPNWQNIGGNIWKISLVDNNYTGYQVNGSSPDNGVGCIYEYDKDVLHGHRVKEKAQLIANWDIWQTDYYDKKTNPAVFDDLYIYLDKNPNQLSLEFSVSTTAATVENSTIENVDFAGFGFGLSCGSGVILRHCIIDMMGGRIISGDKNVCCYGNGVEFYIGATIKNCLVEDCIISRCFDCGITIQCIPAYDEFEMKAYPENIVIRNNLITNCCQGWEEYLNNGPESRFVNCVFENNIVVNSGESGWGYEHSRRKFCHVLNVSLYGNKGMILRNNYFAGGNFVNSLFLNNSYNSNTWENNMVYIAYGYDLVRDPDAAHRIVTLSESKSRSERIKEYRQLTGDYSTRFFVYSDRRVKTIAQRLSKKFKKEHNYL